MFPSNNCIDNPFPQFLLPPPFFDAHEIIFPHHPDLIPSGDLFPASYPATDAAPCRPVSIQPRTPNPETQITLPRKKSKKKDRHSKIHTAQGPRDRRVRLSIEIARQFFDLQDTLGFDKASRTLDWLLTKSKNAIKELQQAELQSVSAYSTASQLVFPKTKDKVSTSSRREDVVARELRAKARARARQRTKEKMGTRSATQSTELSESAPTVLNSADNLINGQICGSRFGQPMRSENYSGAVKRKLKPVSILGDDQSRDFVGTFVRPSFYSMATNTSLIPEFQFCSKSSELWNNHGQC